MNEDSYSKLIHFPKKIRNQLIQRKQSKSNSPKAEFSKIFQNAVTQKKPYYESAGREIVLGASGL